MKHLAGIWLFMLLSANVNTQTTTDNIAPTREETIDYLNQKSKEMIGYSKLGINRKVFIDKRIISESHFKKTATGVELYVRYKTPTYEFFTSTAFNPKHIVSITNNSEGTVTPESPVGALELKFIGKIVLFNNNGETVVTDRATLNYLQSDPGNEGRIVKALEHLRELYKAEDAYFDN